MIVSELFMLDFINKTLMLFAIYSRKQLVFLFVTRFFVIA